VPFKIVLYYEKKLEHKGEEDNKESLPATCGEQEQKGEKPPLILCFCIPLGSILSNSS
jgi:hypothetical protein